MECVFFGASGSIVKWAYSDIINNPQIYYCDFEYEGKKGINRILLSRKLGNILPFVFQNFLYTRVLKYSFFRNLNPNDNILFVFTCQYNMYFDTFFETFICFLKKRYPQSKFVFYYNDMIKTCYPECINMIKKEFDLVLTFDKHDAEEYSITYYGEVYSKISVSDNPETEESDIFYVGTDRGRLDTIIGMFKKVADINLKPVFYINDVSDNSIKKLCSVLNVSIDNKGIVKYKGGILYINIYCPYPKTLSYIKKSKCIAEVLLPEQTGGSLRLAESVTYSKKLLTNFKGVREKPYWRESNIFIFNDSESIKEEDLKKFIETPYIPVSYDFSPLRMIAFAESMLQDNNTDKNGEN